MYGRAGKLPILAAHLIHSKLWFSSWKRENNTKLFVLYRFCNTLIFSNEFCLKKK